MCGVASENRTRKKKGKIRLYLDHHFQWWFSTNLTNLTLPSHHRSHVMWTGQSGLCAVLQWVAGPSPRWPCFIKSSSGPRSFNVIIIGPHVPPPSKHNKCQIINENEEGRYILLLLDGIMSSLQADIKFSFSQIQIICDTGIRTNLLSSKSRLNPLKCRKISLWPFS